MAGRPRTHGLPRRRDGEELLLASGELSDQRDRLLFLRHRRRDTSRAGDRRAGRRLEDDVFRDRPLFERVGFHGGRHEVASGDRRFQHESSGCFDVWEHSAHPSCQLPRFREVGLIQFATHQQFGTAEKTDLQPFTLEVGPLLEGDATRYAERRKERPIVEREGGREILRVQRGEECIPIDRHRPPQCQLFRTDDGVVAEQSTQMKERLPKRIAGAVGIDIRPQEVDERFSRRAPPRRERHEHEQRERLSGSQQELSVGTGRKRGGPKRAQRQRLRHVLRRALHITG